MPERHAPLALCYGTRPQVIKASLLISALEADWELVTIDTGQHYDYELNALLYEQLGVRRPDVLLEVGSAEPAEQTAAILGRAAGVLATRRPWAVIVIGDTNSTLGGALAAAKLRIPVVHVEAGLRAADRLMPEEVNRRVVDAIADLLCAPSESARKRLQRERPDATTIFTGDIARDVMERNLARAPAAGTWSADGPFILATLHRAELTDNRAALRSVLEGFGGLDLPVLWPVHPRTAQTLERYELTGRVPPGVRMVAPLGYLETLGRIRDARLVVTDSGGVQREAYWLGTPCVTVRAETEWTETVALGANTLVAPLRAAAELPNQVARRAGAGASWDRAAYGTGTAALAIGNAVSDLARSR